VSRLGGTQLGLYEENDMNLDAKAPACVGLRMSHCFDVASLLSFFVQARRESLSSSASYILGLHPFPFPASIKILDP
jgi:hypothetical protein